MDGGILMTLLDLENRWNVVIALKHFFVATMIIIHFYKGLILNPKIERISSQPNEKQTSRLKKISLDCHNLPPLLKCFLKRPQR